jgi:hypothetical protein
MIKGTDPIHLMDIRTRIAMDFEAAMLASPETSWEHFGPEFPDRMATMAIRYADALLTALNKSE